MQFEVIKGQMKNGMHFNEGHFLPEKGCHKGKHLEVREETEFAQEEFYF